MSASTVVVAPHLTTSPFDQAHIGRVVKPVVFLDSGFRRAEQTVPGTLSTRARKPGRRRETFWKRTLPQHHLAMMKGYGRSDPSLPFCMTRLESGTADPRQNSRQGPPYMSSLPRWPQSRSLGPNHYPSRLKLTTTSQLSRCAFSAIGRRPVKRPPRIQPHLSEYRSSADRRAAQLVPTVRNRVSSSGGWLKSVFDRCLSEGRWPSFVFFPAQRGVAGVLFVSFKLIKQTMVPECSRMRG